MAWARVMVGLGRVGRVRKGSDSGHILKVNPKELSDRPDERYERKGNCLVSQDAVLKFSRLGELSLTNDKYVLLTVLEAGEFETKVPTWSALGECRWLPTSCSVFIRLNAMGASSLASPSEGTHPVCEGATLMTWEPLQRLHWNTIVGNLTAAYAFGRNTFCL